MSLPIVFGVSNLDSLNSPNLEIQQSLIGCGFAVSLTLEILEIRDFRGKDKTMVNHCPPCAKCAMREMRNKLRGKKLWKKL